MIKLFIVEEYGFRDWYAELTEEEFEKLKTRWRTLRGLTCLVPIPFIIPQAKLLDDEREKDPTYTHRCHIHDYDDSYLQGCDYKIPQDDEYFWMEGKKYSRPELYDLNNEQETRKTGNE